MDVNDSYLHHNTICNGCLSIERKLTVINSAKVSSLFCDLPNSFKKPRIYLCWECIAIIARIIKFQRQVKLASDYLQQQVATRTNISSLSNLVTTETKSLEYSINIQKNITSRTISVQNLQTQTESPFQESLNVIQNKSPYSLENGDQSQNLCEPLKYVCDREEFNVKNGEGSPDYESQVKDDEPTNLEENHFTFIKVEDDNDVCDENIHQEVYDEDLKTVFNHDTDTKKDVKDVSNEGDYNESDDEPLLKKKRKKHARARRRNCEQQPGVVSHPRVEKILKKLNVDQSQLELVVLGWDEIESERNKASQSLAYSGQKYKCPDCILGFNYKFKLDNHMKKHDEAAGNVVCSVCNVRFKSDTALRAHLRRHQVRWRCRICGDLSSRAPVAADHVARIHGASTPVHTCKTCGQKESSLAKLRSHLRNHKQRPKCDLCGKSFLDRASLRAHLFIHFGVKEYSCSHCEKRFLFKKAMEIHVMTHDPSAHLYCHQCDMNFKNRMSYDRHMKYNLKHVDPSKLKHACKLCDKKFLKATRLQEHNMAVHLNAKPISCTMQDCAFTCSSRAVLRTHVRMVHRNARSQRNHVCHTCGKAYTTKKTLEGHMRSHSGERPFRCPLCPSTFGYEAALYNHNKLVHLKIKIRSTSYGQQVKDVEKLNAS